jgi:hypothetical protein
VRRALVPLLTGCALAVTAFVAADESPDSQPVALLRLSAKQVAAGVGWSWGDGTLEFDGKTYPVTVDGLTIGAAGIKELTANGDVYHLSKLEDFEGTYAGVGQGTTVGGGGTRAILRNAKGVEVRVLATSRGVSFTLGVSGVKLAFKK